MNILNKRLALREANNAAADKRSGKLGSGTDYAANATSAVIEPKTSDPVVVIQPAR